MLSRRSDFGVLRKNKDVAYLDCAATTLIPDIVVEAWVEYQKNIGVSIGRGLGILNDLAECEYNKSVKTLKNFFSCHNKYDLIFTKNATESLNLLSYVFSSRLKSGDIILMSEYEHHSNFLSWKRIAQKKGAQVILIPICPDGSLDYSIIQSLPKEDIKIATLTFVSNVNGHILSLKHLYEQLSKDTLVFLDVSQAVGHMKLDFDKINADGYVMSAHKMYAPKNIGACFIRRNVIEELEPFLLGGGMVYNAIGNDRIWQAGEKKFHAGTFDVALVVAWATACKYIENIGWNAVIKHEKIVSQKLSDILYNTGIMEILPHGLTFCNSPCAFFSNRMHAHDIGRLMKGQNIIIRTGHMCSQTTLNAFKLSAVSRISWGISTDDNDIEHFRHALSPANIDEFMRH